MVRLLMGGSRADARWILSPPSTSAFAQKELLAGVRIGTIRTDWQRRGIGHTREGTTRLPHHLVEHMLTNPRLCGYRTYRGEVLLDDDGRPVVGEWEPINTVEEWEAVCAVVAERKQK